tara:strand:- start:3804 stop:4022 length:219 start_codon:yes stop_codon:yes gene_type:complete
VNTLRKINDERRHQNQMVGNARFLQAHAEHLADWLQEVRVQDGKAVMLDDIAQIEKFLEKFLPEVKRYVKSL